MNSRICARSVLVDEDPFAELQVEAVVTVERRVDREGLWHGLAKDLREQRGTSL
jgi:hypothetical protein